MTYLSTRNGAVLHVSVPVPGMDDGDYTNDFLQAGTTFTIDGTARAEHVPVTLAVVRSEVLHLEGVVQL